MTDTILPKAKLDDVQGDVVKHTSGEWYAMTHEVGGILDQASVFSEQGGVGPVFIADTWSVDDEAPLEERKANARLIAAAPDLVDAVEQALDDMGDSHCVCEATKQQLIAALAKAEDGCGNG